MAGLAMESFQEHVSEKLQAVEEGGGHEILGDALWNISFAIRIRMFWSTFVLKKSHPSLICTNNRAQNKGVLPKRQVRFCCFLQTYKPFEL